MTEMTRDPMSPAIRRLAVLGLGKLGSCIAATFASRGFEVVGFDIDPTKVEALVKGRAPVEEPKLRETVEAADRKSTRLNSSHIQKSRMPSSA